MIDIETNQPLRVNTEGDAGPYLMVPLDQLSMVRQVLGEHQISYSVDEDAIELDGSPVIAIINFGRNASAAQIQEALDAA